MKDIRFNIPLTDEELAKYDMELSVNDKDLLISIDASGKILETCVKGTTYSISVITDREELLLIDILNIESKRIQLYSIKPDFDDSVGAVAFKMLYGDKIIIKVKNEIIM